MPAVPGDFICWVSDTSPWRLPPSEQLSRVREMHLSSSACWLHSAPRQNTARECAIASSAWTFSDYHRTTEQNSQATLSCRRAAARRMGLAHSIQHMRTSFHHMWTTLQSRCPETFAETTSHCLYMNSVCGLLFPHFNIVNTPTCPSWSTRWMHKECWYRICCSCRLFQLHHVGDMFCLGTVTFDGAFSHVLYVKTAPAHPAVSTTYVVRISAQPVNELWSFHSLVLKARTPHNSLLSYV